MTRKTKQATVKVQFSKERETKNTVRFQEVSDTPNSNGPVIGTLYVQKSALEELGNPEELTLSIKAQVA